jgi:hypothetical protein
MRKLKLVALILLIVVIGFPLLSSCDTAKNLIYDNKEILKQVLVEVIDQMIEMINNIPSASISKTLMRMSPDSNKMVIDIRDEKNNTIKLIEYDILKRYKELKGK